MRRTRILYDRRNGCFVYRSQYYCGATTEGAGLFDTWYQQVLFIGDILFGAGFIASVVLYIIGKAGKRKIAEGNES